MAGRKFDPKEMAVEAFYSAKALGEQFLDDFRSRDRFFKYKAGIIAAWAAVSVLTLGISCGGGPKENNLHARTQVTQVLDDYTVLLRNTSSSDWKDVRLTLNSRYTAYTPVIAAGDKYVIAVKQFVGPQGEVPAKDLKPQSLKVVCSDGADVLDLTKREGPP